MTSTSTSTARMVASAGALATVLSLAACGSHLAGSGGSLPLLRIGTSSYGAADAVAARASGSGAAGSSQDPYPLSGTLPDGPSSATVYRFSADASSSTDVAALAKALGVAGTPARHAHGWEVSSKAGDVRVHDGGTAWSYARGTSDCPSYAVDIDNADGSISSSGCTVAIPPGDILTLPGAGSSGSGGGVASGSASAVPCPGPTPPATPPPYCTGTADSSTTTTRPPLGNVPPTDAGALAAAMPVLAAVGLDAEQARVLDGADGYPVRTVVLDPTVDGLRTSGDRTVVDVDTDGVLGATGVLATPTAGDSYPIVTAAAALDLLRAMPQPEIAIACVQGKVCPGIGPKPVTGAVLGLSMAYDAGAPVLVPAWLFTVTGSDEPVAVVAVEQKYLADPTQGPNPVGSGPDASSAPNPGSSGGGSDSSPGSPGGSGPATPVPVTEPPAPVLSVQSVTLGKDGTTLVLGGVGGVCDDYSGKAEETSTTVTVSIVATPKTPDGVCPALAKEFTVTVTLSAPWDNRTIVDAASGTTLTLG